jgi:hypothetical protein
MSNAIPEETAPNGVRQHHKKTSSSLSEFTLYEIFENEVKEVDPVNHAVLPMSTLVVVAESEKLSGQWDESIHDFDFQDDGTFKISNWGGKRFYSDYIKAGIDYKKKEDPKYDPASVVMLFESPSSSTTDSTFHNREKFRFHDWPPANSKSKGVLGPNRYASMNGSSYPVFLRDGVPPAGLMGHWESFLPGFVKPNFVDKIDTDKDMVYAYLPIEQLKHHVNDPDSTYPYRMRHSSLTILRKFLTCVFSLPIPQRIITWRGRMPFI